MIPGSNVAPAIRVVQLAPLTLSKSTLVSSKKVSSEEFSRRWSHAKELFGRHFDKSIVNRTRTVKNLKPFVLKKVKESLPKKWQSSSHALAKAILKQSKKHKFDPILVMAVIMRESSFNPETRGGVGELGLMQIKPDTAEWICQKMGLAWRGSDSLLDPVTNVEIGTAYIAYLRDLFDSHGQLYLAAYNMGQGNVARFVASNILPKEYPGAVMANYVEYYRDISEKSKKPLRAPASLVK